MRLRSGGDAPNCSPQSSPGTAGNADAARARHCAGANAARLLGVEPKGYRIVTSADRTTVLLPLAGIENSRTYCPGARPSNASGASQSVDPEDVEVILGWRVRTSTFPLRIRPERTTE